MAKKNSFPEPWERQPDETAKQFEAFAIYRDLGIERSLSKVGGLLGKSKTLMDRWSTANSWVERAAAWDREQDRILRQQQLDDIKKMRKRHADLATAMLAKTARAMQKIPVEEIKAGDIGKWLEVASKLERISRGDVGEVVEERAGGTTEDVVRFYIPDNGREENPEKDN